MAPDMGMEHTGEAVNAPGLLASKWRTSRGFDHGCINKPERCGRVPVLLRGSSPAPSDSFLVLETGGSGGLCPPRPHRGGCPRGSQRRDSSVDLSVVLRPVPAFPQLSLRSHQKLALHAPRVLFWGERPPFGAPLSQPSSTLTTKSCSGRTS